MCALYLALHIIRMAIFWSLLSRLSWYPQAVVQNWKWLLINELYINFRAEWGRKCFNLFIIPTTRDILLDIFLIWEHHVEWSNYYKTTGIVKNATTKSFYLFCGSIWQITLLIMNWYHKQLLLKNILAHIVLWGLCWRTITFSLTWLFLVALKTYNLSSAPHVPF